MPAFRTRYLVLNAVNSITKGEATVSRISRETKLNAMTVKQHLAFLQVKDYLTVADFTVEDRESLRRRTGSWTPFVLTPKGRGLLTKLNPLVRELTSDKTVSELQPKSTRSTAILTE